MEGFNEDNIMGVSGIAEWRKVKEDFTDDEVTSQGDSIVAPSPLYAEKQDGIDFFVPEYLAAGQYCINDDDDE